MSQVDLIIEKAGKIYQRIEERKDDGYTYEELADLYEISFDKLSSLLEEAIAVIKSMEEDER